MTDRDKLSPALRQIMVDGKNREPNDFYPTPAGATEALLRHVSFGPTIWEPACGEPTWREPAYGEPTWREPTWSVPDWREPS